MYPKEINILRFVDLNSMYTKIIEILISLIIINSQKNVMLNRLNHVNRSTISNYLAETRDNTIFTNILSLDLLG